MRYSYSSRSHVQRVIFPYTEGWYNPHRLHSVLGYFSPIAFERSQRFTAAALISHLSTKAG